MSLKYAQCPIFYLAGSGALIGATSIVVTSFTDIYGNVLTMADFGSKGYGTHEPDTTNAEGIIFTGVTANANGTYTLTGVSTILAKSPYTETSGLIRNHAGGTKFVITDNVAFWNTFGNKLNDETLTGRWGTGVAPSSGNDLVNKTYADGLAIAGAPDASTLTKGISKLSTAPVSSTNPIVVGDNDTRVPTASQAAALAGTGTPSGANKFVTEDTDALKELLSNKSTNGTMASNSDTLYPSQKATKTYVDAHVISEHADTFSTGSQTTTVNVDTVITCGFAPRMIQISFTLNGVTSSAGKVTTGIITASSTGAIVTGLIAQQDGVLSTANNFGSPTAGSAAGNYAIVVLSITAVSGTGFTLRIAFTNNGGVSSSATGSIFAIA